MTNELTTTNQTALTTPGPMDHVGQAANTVAAASVIEDYRSRKADNTLLMQDAGLALFAEYLQSVGVRTYGDDQPLTGVALTTDPAAWGGLTWGLVEGFTRWLLNTGFATGTINVRLSTVKTYAKLAAKAGHVDKLELTLIRAVAGYGHAEAQRVDSHREAAELPTRLGYKKADPVTVSRSKAKALKAPSGPTGQGLRDALLMTLLIDHGLRVGEVAGLRVGAFDLEARTFTFYRPKVGKQQTHELSRDAYAAAVAYFAAAAPDDAEAPLIRASRKGGHLTHAGISTQKLKARVAELGRRVGVISLSPHDLRHHWATVAARNRTPIDRLQDAGGWSSPAMPLRYVEAAAIANEGVNIE